MNALERYRNEHGMTFEALGAAAGFDKGNAHKHCRADPIPPEAVLRYHAAYAIPLEDLRPDLYPTPGQGIPCDPASSSREPGQGEGEAIPHVYVSHPAIHCRCCGSMAVISDPVTTAQYREEGRK